MTESRRAAQPAVRIGGKNAPRRAAIRKGAAGSSAQEVNVSAVMGASGYKLHPVAKVENCSFIGKTGMIINYDAPDVQAIMHKGSTPVGYILSGKGELLSKGDAGSGPSFDIEVIQKALAEKGIDISDLVERVQEGDKDAMNEIISKLKEVDFSEPQDDKDQK